MEEAGWKEGMELLFFSGLGDEDEEEKERDARER